MIEYVTPAGVGEKVGSSRRRNVTGACLVSLSRNRCGVRYMGLEEGREQVGVHGCGTGLEEWECDWSAADQTGALAITEQVPEASAFTRSSTLIVRRDGTILASENHNRGDISTGTCLIR